MHGHDTHKHSQTYIHTSYLDALLPPLLPSSGPPVEEQLVAHAPLQRQVAHGEAELLQGEEARQVLEPPFPPPRPRFAAAAGGGPCLGPGPCCFFLVVVIGGRRADERALGMFVCICACDLRRIWRKDVCTQQKLSHATVSDTDLVMPQPKRHILRGQARGLEDARGLRWAKKRGIHQPGALFHRKACLLLGTHQPGAFTEGMLFFFFFFFFLINKSHLVARHGARQIVLLAGHQVLGEALGGLGEEVGAQRLVNVEPVARRGEGVDSERVGRRTTCGRKLDNKTHRPMRPSSR